MYHHLGHQRITDCSHGNCWVRGGGDGSGKRPAKAECSGVPQGTEARPNIILPEQISELIIFSGRAGRFYSFSGFLSDNKIKQAKRI